MPRHSVVRAGAPRAAHWRGPTMLKRTLCAVGGLAKAVLPQPGVLSESSSHARDDVYPYLVGYSSDHIVTIMGLSECSFFDSNGYFGSGCSGVESRSGSEGVYEVVSRSEGEEIEGEKEEIEGDGESEEVESEDVEDEDEEVDVSEMLERPSVVISFGVGDGHQERQGVPQARGVDIGTCDSSLTHEELFGGRSSCPLLISSFFLLWGRELESLN